MITNLGFSEMLKFISGHASEYGQALAFGAGQSPATINDGSPDSESLRQALTVRSPDFVSGSVIFKTTLPPEVSGKFYELALVSEAESRVSQVLFGNSDEVWINGTLDDTNARVGSSAVRIDAAASGSKTATIDKSISLGSQSITLNYFVGSNVSSAYVRLMTDSSNYYQYNLPVTAGYKSVNVPISAFTATGTPNKESITSVAVSVSSTAGGASALHFDALMLVSTEQGGDVLLRQVLPQPITKLAGIEMDIELPLDINI